jgi:hypothetical protein
MGHGSLGKLAMNDNSIPKEEYIILSQIKEK